MTRFTRILLPIFIFVLGTAAASAQDMYPAKRIHSPVVIRDSIGGESHAVYAIKVGKGQRLSVKLWYDKDQLTDDVTLERGVTAGFDVLRGSHLDTATMVTYGTRSRDGRVWSATIRRAGNYLIDVIAHPVANFTLRVKVK